MRCTPNVVCTSILSQSIYIPTLMNAKLKSCLLMYSLETFNPYNGTYYINVHLPLLVHRSIHTMVMYMVEIPLCIKETPLYQKTHFQVSSLLY